MLSVFTLTNCTTTFGLGKHISSRRLDPGIRPITYTDSRLHHNYSTFRPGVNLVCFALLWKCSFDIILTEIAVNYPSSHLFETWNSYMNSRVTKINMKTVDTEIILYHQWEGEFIITAFQMSSAVLFGIFEVVFN